MRVTKEVVSSSEATFTVLNKRLNRNTVVPRDKVSIITETADYVTFEITIAFAKALSFLPPEYAPSANVKQTLAEHTATSPDPWCLVPPGTARRLKPNAPAPAQCHDPRLNGKLQVGRYTVVFDSANEGDYVTLRVDNWENRQGVLIIAFLKGPDNASNYQNFASVEGGKLRVWNRFVGFKRQIRAAELLIKMTEEGRYDAGEAYALRSSNCCKCGRDLSVAKSIKRGMGPDCWAKYAPLDVLAAAFLNEKAKKPVTVIVTSRDGQVAVPLSDLPSPSPDPEARSLDQLVAEANVDVEPSPDDCTHLLMRVRGEWREI